ncbi:MAG: hypothetical protein SGJ20_00515 [Planctomycetota bacterium]|nr:hypothetical protein [Planctomycetota bacterium]
MKKVSDDYWSQDDFRRTKSRKFIEQTCFNGIHIAFTFTHVLELLAHKDNSKVRDRIKFLRGLPLIAWLRPYDRNGSPGSLADVLRRELHAVIHEAKSDWKAIVEQVRADIWETGVGSEIFIDDEAHWQVLGAVAQDHNLRRQYIASVVRTDPGGISDLKIGDAKRLQMRPKEERTAFLRQFVQIMVAQLKQHGDQRLDNPDAIAADFATGIQKELENLESTNIDSIQQMFECWDLPQELVTDNMTIGEFSELVAYKHRLVVVSRQLHPPAKVSIREFPPNTLPAEFLQRKLAEIQRKAARVSGSDLGDTHIAPLVLHADGVEVDKRTHEYLIQMKRAHPALGSLMGRFFRSTDYATIPDVLSKDDP